MNAQKGGATFMQSCQRVTSYRTKPPVISGYWHVPSTRIREWLPQIAHFNIFVLAHKNAIEPATSLLQVRSCGRTPAACKVLWQM